MFFQKTEEETMYCDAVKKLLAEAAPVQRVQALDKRKEFDFELHRALAEVGAWGVGVGEAQGGSDGGPVMQVLTLELLGQHATSMAVFGVIQYMATRLLRQFGTPEQQQRYLPALCSGALRASFCLTEAGGGTDILSSMRTSAQSNGDGWRLQGSKYWISGATRSDVLIVVARTGAHRSRGITMFLVDARAEGVQATELDTFAINGYDTCSVTFDDVKLPPDAVLGTIDQGFMQVLGTLNSERLNAAAVASGIGRGAHKLAVDYAKEREAFGHPIGQFQALQHKLVHTGVDLEAAWTLTLGAARLEEQGRDVSDESAMAKLAAAAAGRRAADTGMEVLGAAAFDLDLPMQRYYRDIRLYSFAPLTDNMISNFLGERWLGLPRSY
ncbi:MAG: acyl-CoA/acyl-ACP dehydrogenase [Burkholderiaceae bacterium]|jgi:acyl-CoA dehydrogenase|nr:acyl-CoA/acyl-ACP dehydrogenase [Burkholderiaceae bacterium]